MMNESMEERLRRHLHSVDDAPVREAQSVSTAAERIARTHRRRRRALATVSSVVLVVLASLVLWTSRAHAPSVAPAGPDARSSTTQVSPTTTAPQGPTTTTAENGPTTTVATSSGFAPIAPDPRGVASFPAAVWTGTEVLVVGGLDLQGHVRAGASAYDPASDTWRVLASPPGESPRPNPVVAWTGSEMLVIGGGEYDGTQMSGDGLAYDPATDTWRSIGQLPGFVTDRSPAVWAGTELFVWPFDQSGTPAASPVALDVASGSWRQLPTPPIGPRQQAASVWTGTEWIIWGGRSQAAELADGAAFNPTTNTWRTIAASPLAPRRVRAVWTGSEMLISAGASGGDPLTGNNELAMADGAAYDPGADSWHKISDGFAHPGFLPVWTGDQMIMFAKAGAVVYDVATDQWIDMCCSVDNGGVGGGTPVWTGSVVVLVGSYEPTIGGVTFTPPVATAPVVNTPSSNPPPPALTGAHQVVDMSFVDAQHGWMLEADDSSTSVLLATSDGGATWKAPSVDTRKAAHVKFADRMNGWMYGGDSSSFQSTHDGGATWQPVDLAQAGMIDGVQALASDGNTVTIVSGIAAADQNVNWSAATSPVDTDNFARIGIDFPQGAGPANDWSIATSGGDTWIVYNDRTVTGTGRTLNGVAAPWAPPWTDLFGPASVTATGNGGPLYALVTAFAWNGVPENQLYVSEDRGTTFRQLTPPPGIAEFPPSGLVVADPSTVVITVAQSDDTEALYRSVDKGSTWQLLASFGAGQGVENVAFADGTTAYGTSQPNPDGQPTRLMKSVDGGATWQPIAVP
ncbi:MAG: YCF48-related protein [Ilumatobacteraceae bacterium]